MTGSTDPVGLPGLAAFATGSVFFLLAVLAARWRSNPGNRAGTTRSQWSIVGVALQAIGIALVGWGPVRVMLDPLGTTALVEAAIVGSLMLITVALFVWSARSMGRNWSIVARTRADHRLVTTGPFALMRHPIYLALALFTLALALAVGHARALVIGGPLFALGTWLRVREEERLLRERFGAAYDAYARRMKRFVPRLF